MTFFMIYSTISTYLKSHSVLQRTRVSQAQRMLDFSFLTGKKIKKLNTCEIILCLEQNLQLTYLCTESYQLEKMHYISLLLL